MFQETMRRKKVWEEFMREVTAFFQNQEPLEDFQARMEKRGFTVDFRTPTDCDGLSDVEFVESVIGYLNHLTGTRFHTNVKTANAKTILQRRAEGWSMLKLKKIIDRQCQRWLDTKWQEALTPLILFGKEKIDIYYGQIVNLRNEPAQSSGAAPDPLDAAVAGAKRSLPARSTDGAGTTDH